MSAQPEAIRCAVVGLGRVGSLLEDDELREKPATHTGAIVANEDCELVGGCDIDEQRRAAFRDRWGCPQTYGDVEKLIAETRPDILCVATHPDSHYRMVRAASRGGVTVAVCEKPLAHRLGHAKRIARLHRSGLVTVITNHERRYSADYLAVRECVRSGTYGRILSVRGTLYFGQGRHDQVLLHDGTHMVDIINFLLGGRAHPARRFGRMRSRTSSAYLFGRIKGVPVVIEVGSERDHLVFELELSFERGRVRVGNGVLSFEGSVESPFYENYRSLRLEQTPAIEKTGYFANMIADAVRCVRDPAHEPVSSAADGLEVMRFISAVRARR
ncbi:MAG: Gfo/Idh/MocA family protein [Spirochaetota bacterium]